MGAKAPAKASELISITTRAEIKKYFKSHVVDNESENYDEHIDEIISRCLVSDMPLIAFQYLMEKIGPWAVIGEYEYIKSRITYSDKSLCVLSYLGYKIRDFISYTYDERILEHLMYVELNAYRIRPDIVKCLIDRYKKLNIATALNKFHTIVIHKFSAPIMEVFDKHDASFKLADLLDKNDLRRYYKDLNEWHSE